MTDKFSERLYVVAFVSGGNVMHLELGPFIDFGEACDAKQELYEECEPRTGMYVVLESEPIAWLRTYG